MASDQAILIVVCKDENVKVKIRLSKKKKKKKGNIITRHIIAVVAVHLNVPHTLATET